MSVTISKECKQAQAEFQLLMNETAENDAIEYESFVRMVVRKVRKIRTSVVRCVNKVLLCGAESASGKCESMLMSENGASMEEMLKLRGAVNSLLNSLKKAGYNIIRENSRYYYRPVVA